VYRLGVATVTNVVATVTDAMTITITVIAIAIATTIITVIIIPKRITLYDHHSINREQKEHTIIIALLYIDEQSCNQRR
jgi:hypothetical protein